MVPAVDSTRCLTSSMFWASSRRRLANRSGIEAASQHGRLTLVQGLESDRQIDRDRPTIPVGPRVWPVELCDLQFHHWALRPLRLESRADTERTLSGLLHYPHLGIPLQLASRVTDRVEHRLRRSFDPHRALDNGHGPDSSEPDGECADVPLCVASYVAGPGPVRVSLTAMKAPDRREGASPNVWR